MIRENVAGMRLQILVSVVDELSQKNKRKIEILVEEINRFKINR